MKYECAKCNEDCLVGQMMVEGGIGYLFCKPCANLLDSSPTGTITNFISETKKESWVAKNMRLARESRELGESLWSKQAEG